MGGCARVGRCGGMLGGGGARDPRSFFGKKRSGLKIGNKSRHTFSEGFFGRYSQIFNFFFNFLKNHDFLQNFEFGVVRKCVNLVDLEKC